MPAGAITARTAVSNGPDPKRRRAAPIDPVVGTR
jgi:hypothetical protein